MDCDGKSFLCHTDSSYLQCAGQPDGSFRTISTEIQYCPPETYCDHNYGDYECISPAIPSEGMNHLHHFYFVPMIIDGHQ